MEERSELHPSQGLHIRGPIPWMLETHWVTRISFWAGAGKRNSAPGPQGSPPGLRVAGCSPGMGEQGQAAGIEEALGLPF